MYDLNQKSIRDILKYIPSKYINKGNFYRSIVLDREMLVT
jgi:hypothetical protein